MENARRALIESFLVAVAGATVYQGAKDLIFPHLSLWGSHVNTILAFGLVAACATFVASRKNARLTRLAADHSAAYLRAERDRDALADAIEQASDSIVITDRRGNIQYVNPAFSTLTGYTAQEAIGQNPRILVSGRQAAEFYKEMWNTIVSGNIWQGELVNRRKDGTLYVEEMTITPVREPDGAISRFIAIKKDATARRETREARALLASIVESSEDAIFANTPDGRITTWNRGAEELYGYRAGEILGRPLSMLVCPENQELLNQNQQAMLRGEKLPAFDGVGIRKDGTRIDILLRPFPVKNDAGRIVGCAAIVRDISLRKEAEQARGLLASIVDSTEDAIFSNALDGAFLTWNKGAEAMWGYRSAEMIGKSIALLVPPERLPEQGRVLDGIRRGESSQFESETMRMDGSIVQVALTVSPVRNGAGGVVGCSTIARDIGGRKRAEQALRQNERKYRSLISNIPDVVWTANSIGEPVFASDRCEGVCGFKAAEICRPGAWRALIHPDDLPHFDAVIHAMRASSDGSWVGQSYNEEYRIRRKDGQWVWVHSRATGVYERDGLRYVDGLLSDITARKLMEQDLAYQVTHDALTGLPNRQVLDDSLHQALEVARRRGRQLALLTLDLDGFKLINNTLGRQAGDDLLRQFGLRLKGCLRDSEILARVGGDEFELILSQKDDPRMAPRIAERLLAALSAPFHGDHGEVFLSASIGIALYPRDGRDSAELHRNADAAMQAAKRYGKNRYQMFTAAMGVTASRRLAIQTELHHAIERHELSLHYQPKVDLTTGEVVGMEALLRWENAKLGTVGPSEFIPVAEATGLILPVSQWVLREACRQQVAWRTAGCRPVQVAVNISAAQFIGGHLPATVRRVLAENDLDPKCLDLEITESAVMQDLTESARQLRELKQLGVSISLDDFGTGYSSLNYLARLPIDNLKIDQGFVRRMESSEGEATLMHAMIALAHGFRMKAVAEGVESVHDLEALRALGCDLAQGYLLSKPLPAALVPQLLAMPHAVGQALGLRMGSQPRPGGLRPLGTALPDTFTIICSPEESDRVQ